VLKNIELTEFDKLDQDEVNKLLFDKFRVVYEQIHQNYATHGYAKSPDFHFKQEKL
jgi:hypothetical protein